MNRIRIKLRLLLVIIGTLLAASILSVSAYGSGGYSHDSSIGYSAPDWMSGLPDTLLISELTIPGTHDTMAKCGNQIYQCQSITLEEQLDAGVRVLDIRARPVWWDLPAPVHFDITHGCQQNSDSCEDLGLNHYEFDNVLCRTINFLDDHPGETVLMNVQDAECYLTPPLVFEWIYLNYVEYQEDQAWLEPCLSNGEEVLFRDYIWDGDYTSIPTLGEVRGKIVILDNFADGTYGIKWLDNEIIASVQNIYLIYDKEYKRGLIKDHLDAADTGYPDILYINFLSGTGGGKIPYPWDVASSTNEYTYDFLRNIPDVGVIHRWGIIMSDFPGEGLLDSIINANFPSGWGNLVSANGPYVGNEGSVINFEASPQGNLQYSWSFSHCDEDTQGVCIPGTEWLLTTDWSRVPTTSYTWVDDWSGTAAVQITNSIVTHYDETSVTINNVDPAVTIDGLQIETGAVLGSSIPVSLVYQSIQLTGSFTDPGVLDTHTAVIDWGDSSIDHLGAVEGLINSSHTYTQPGTYEISLTVTDDDGGMGTASAQVRVVSSIDGLKQIIDELAALPEDPDIAAALADLIGNNNGKANNGALDMLETGNLNAAVEKIGHAIQDLEPAGQPDVQASLTLIAKGIVMEAIDQIDIANVNNNGLRMIQQAQDLITQGDALLAGSDYLGALEKYQQAVRKVQGLV